MRTSFGLRRRRRVGKTCQRKLADVSSVSPSSEQNSLVILIGYLKYNTISPLFADYQNRSFPEPFAFVEHAPSRKNLEDSGSYQREGEPRKTEN